MLAQQHLQKPTSNNSFDDNQTKVTLHPSLHSLAVALNTVSLNSSGCRFVLDLITAQLSTQHTSMQPHTNRPTSCCCCYTEQDSN